MRQSKDTYSINEPFPINPNAVAHLHPRNCPRRKDSTLYRHTLKQRFVLFALSKLLQNLKQKQENVIEEIKGTKFIVGEDEQNKFLRGGMRKRVVNNHVKKGVYYTTIEPISSYVKGLRKIIGEVQGVVQGFRGRGWLVEYRKAMQVKTSRGENMSVMSNSSHRSRIRVRTQQADAEQPPKLTKQRSNFTDYKSTIIQKAIDQKLLKNFTQSGMLRSISKQLNSFALRKSEYQQMAMKNILKTVNQKAALVRTDLMVVERSASYLKQEEKAALVQILTEVNHLTGALMQKLAELIYQGGEGRKRSHKSELQPVVSKKVSVVYSKTLEEQTFRFRQLENKLAIANNRFVIQPNSNTKLIVNTENSPNAFQQLSSLSSKVRYFLGFLHKQIQQISESIQSSRCSRIVETFSATLEQQKAENMRVLNFTKAIKKKYNMDYESNISSGLQKSKSLYFKPPPAVKELRHATQANDPKGIRC